MLRTYLLTTNMSHARKCSWRRAKAIGSLGSAIMTAATFFAMFAIAAVLALITPATYADFVQTTVFWTITATYWFLYLCFSPVIYLSYEEFFTDLLADEDIH